MLALIQAAIVFCILLAAIGVNAEAADSALLADAATTQSSSAEVNWPPDKQLIAAITEQLPRHSREGRSWRLPNTTYPLQYQLHIITHIHRGIREFEASCIVDIYVQQDTDELVLHALFLKVRNVSLEVIGAQTLQPRAQYRQLSELLIITVKASERSAGKHVFLRDQQLRLSILYTGHIWAGSLGLHTISYKDANNQTVLGAVTQFEAIYARSMLPCYDEPRFKSNFTLQITHGSNFTALSNMPAKSVLIASTPGMFTTSFSTTPKMSTYLLAIAVSTYVSISAVDDDGVLHRVYMASTVKENYQPTLTNELRAVKTFGDYMQSPYPLPKLDSFIEKADESLGNGMENWGLSTYADVDVPQTDEPSTFTHVRHLYVQNHEIVHQWFGNLVTPAWWTHLWLKEGFAAYYGYRLMDMLQPDYAAMDIFQYHICYDALSGFDLSIPPKKQDTYEENLVDMQMDYNMMSYNRAPCVIQMFDYALGQEAFHNGIIKFLKDNAYSAVEPKDLYDALQLAVETHHIDVLQQYWNHTIEDLMTPWVATKGCPLITVTRNYDPDNLHLVHIRQTPMFWLDNTTNTSTPLWWIPLNFATQSQPDFSETTADIYMPPTSEIIIDLRQLNISLEPDDWLIVNKRALYFYHVRYDTENLRRLGNALQRDANAIHPHNRRQILHTLNELVITHTQIAGKISRENKNMTENFLELLQFMRAFGNEDHPLVWNLISQTIVENSYRYKWPLLGKLWKPFTLFMSNLLSAQFERYRTKLESGAVFSVLEKILTPQFLDLACRMELPGCIAEARKTVLAQMESAEQQPNQATQSMLNPSMCVCGAAMNLTDVEFERALQFFTAEDERWWRLACTKSLHQFESLLQWVVHIEASDSEMVCRTKMEFLANHLHVAEGERRVLVLRYVDALLLPSAETIPCFMAFCDELHFLIGTVAAENKKRVMEILNMCEEHRVRENLTEFETFLEKEEDIGEVLESVYANADVERIYEWLLEANAAHANSVN